MDTARQLSIAEAEPNGSVADPQFFGNLTKARAVGAQDPHLVVRHSLATFLINKEQDSKTVQGLLRHANVSTTLGLYAQSVNSSMVEAQESMLKAILRNGSNAVN